MNARGIRIGLVGTGMLFLTSLCAMATEFAVQDTLHPACPEPPPVEFSPGHLWVPRTPYARTRSHLLTATRIFRGLGWDDWASSP